MPAYSWNLRQAAISTTRSTRCARPPTGSQDLPDAATDLKITEINTALFPIITIILSGPVPERMLNSLAEDIQKAVEALPGVLEVDIGGARDEFLEVLIDPTVFQTYNLSFDELIGQLQRNNQLIAAGRSRPAAAGSS